MFQIMPVIYEAELEKSKAEVNVAEIEYQTTKNLADSNIVSKSELAMVKARFNHCQFTLRNNVAVSKILGGLIFNFCHVYFSFRFF